MNRRKRRIPYRSQVIHRKHEGASHQGMRLIIGVMVVVGLITFAQLFVANYFSTKGTDLAHLLAQKESLREENDILKARLAKLTSLAHVAAEAQNLGLVTAQSVVFMPEQTPAPPLALSND